MVFRRFFRSKRKNQRKVSVDRDSVDSGKLSRVTSVSSLSRCCSTSSLSDEQDGSSSDYAEYHRRTYAAMEITRSMLCIQEELGQLSLESPDDRSTDTSDIPSQPSLHNPSGINKVEHAGWLDWTRLTKLSVCWRPFCSFVDKFSSPEFKTNIQDEWEIPFESISDLQWLGSGAQGAVFSGKLRSEIVAVKKVREQKETDIRHLRKLNHPNIVKFKGVCTQAPCYCIVMEYCAYGPLYNLLKDGEEVPPQRLYNWARQIAAGMNYLHSKQIIHRDLKSPNVLIGSKEEAKISDFGTCREWNNKSTKMSFAGTVAWMAPEVIRNEQCSDKIDIWSYGIVLWELLTCETPYKDVDSSAIIWGVGSSSLHLPIPSTCPDGFQLLMKMCWSNAPSSRPSFKQILSHLDIASQEVLRIQPEPYYKMQMIWKEEIRVHMLEMQANKSHVPKFEEFEDDLIKKRENELKHAQDVREHYERKLERANQLYLELSAVRMHLDQREQELLKREKQTAKICRKRLVPKIKERLNKGNKRCCESSPTSPDSPVHLAAYESPVQVPLVTHLNSRARPESIAMSTTTAPQQPSFRPRTSRSRPRKATLVTSPTHSPNHHTRRSYTMSAEAGGIVVSTQTQTEPLTMEPMSPTTADVLNGNVVAVRHQEEGAAIRLSDDENLEKLGARVSAIKSYHHTNNINANVYVGGHDSMSSSRDEDDLLENAFALRRKSASRRPIGPGCRTRKPKLAISHVLCQQSDEDNTSDSMARSTQSSTLESPPINQGSKLTKSSDTENGDFALPSVSHHSV
ncbi:hypothetical protein M8J77_006838 [Diaphorina citri]|nr:hypothetical protein M8J77_006838 [Diaphorina citri]